MRWIVRNWHLKLGALGLSTILYTGLVFSGSFSEHSFPGVTVTSLNQPAGTYLLSQQLGTVDIRYRIAIDAPQRVTAESFAVTVDLSNYDLEQPATPQPLPIVVRPLIEGLTILSYSPASAPVNLDLVGERNVRVVVDRGEIPDGLEAGDAQVSDSVVVATGPESLLGSVDRAVARVLIDESGIDVATPVELVAVDVDGRPVPSVELTPGTVTVRIEVSTVETSKTVAVRPVLTGTPAGGYELGAVRVDPAVVTLRGDPQALADVSEVVTRAISLVGATATLVSDVELQLPPGTRLADAATGTATVTVEVRAVVASRTVVVGIDCQGAPDGGACLPAISQVAILIQGTLADLDALEPADLIPVIDVSGLAAGTYQLAPEVALPGGITLISISPGEVEVEVVAPGG